ncbi:hypothetical protein R1flu_009031 [Riccia fluitans]|uniref:Uncharacterized protein n=1 Tax=Riccia fluitans TaxID=41844 RepID=A0ABD1Z0X8_9MARC
MEDLEQPFLDLQATEAVPKLSGLQSCPPRRGWCTTGLKRVELRGYHAARQWDMHITKREEDVGFYAGFIGTNLSSGTSELPRFRACEIITFVVEGLPVVRFCMTEGVVQYSLIGLMVGAACRLVRQRSAVGTVEGLGMILGPAIGGYLSQPVGKYPGILAAGSLFDQKPCTFTKMRMLL